MRDSDTLSGLELRNWLFARLDAIEKHPGAFGSLDAIEGIYWSYCEVLCYPDDGKQVRNVFIEVSKSPIPLSRQCATPGELVEKLREVRKKLSGTG